MDVSFKPSTIGTLIDETCKLMGDQLFTSYNAKTNNCQVFINSILKANGSLTPEISSSIIQNAEDIAAQTDRLLKSEGVSAHTLLTIVNSK